MYAVVSSGGKQYKVQKGEILRVEKISGDIGFKYKKRKRYRRTQGHRQQYTAVKIDNIAQNS